MQNTLNHASERFKFSGNFLILLQLITFHPFVRSHYLSSLVQSVMDSCAQRLTSQAESSRACVNERCRKDVDEGKSSKNIPQEMARIEVVFTLEGLV